MKKHPRPFIVLSAPSGAGKTTIARKLAERNPNLQISISATTRPKRPLETDGIDYFFLSDDEFSKNLKERNFLEHETVHGFRYGTLRTTLEKMAEEGKQIIFDIDVKGALSIKRLRPEAILIFIKPPSLAELRQRLKARQTETVQAIRKRLGRLKYEYQQADKFDHVVINDQLDRAVREIESLINQKN
jgi:guanylate kinase